MKSKSILTLFLTLSAGLVVFLLRVEVVEAQLKTWNRIDDVNQRFQVLSLFNNAAVLDKETGLIWEKAPDNTAQDWSTAVYSCNTNSTGDRMGWRLPTVEELTSLRKVHSQDDSNDFSTPSLPSGHPFQNVQTTYYWTSTRYNADSTKAMLVNFGQFNIGPLFVLITPDTLDGLRKVWCVRGGAGHHAGL